MAAATKTRPKTASIAANNNSAPIGRTQNRVLTEKQLKDTIVDIYAQKVKFDKKCFDNGYQCSDSRP